MRCGKAPVTSRKKSLTHVALSGLAWARRRFWDAHASKIPIMFTKHGNLWIIKRASCWVFSFCRLILTPRTCSYSWNSGLETQTTCATTKATAARGQPFGCITVPWYHSDWYVMNGHLFLTLGDWDSQPMPGFLESREASCDFVSFLNVQSQDLRMSLVLGYTKAFVQSCRHCRTPAHHLHIFTL